MKSGFEDAAHHGQIDLARTDEQPGEQVEARVAAEVAHGGGIALTDFDEPGLGEPLDRLTDRGPRHAEHLGEPSFAWQRLAGPHVAAEHLGDDLVEDVLGDRSTVDGL